MNGLSRWVGRLRRLNPERLLRGEGKKRSSSTKNWVLERIDLDSKERLTALFRRGGDSSPLSHLGVWVRPPEEEDGASVHIASDYEPLVFPATEDPVLFRSRPWEEMRRTVSLLRDGRPVCVAYRPLKRAVFSVPGGSDIGDEGTRFLKLKRKPLSPAIRSVLNRSGLWPEMTVLEEDRRGPVMEAWSHAGGTSLESRLATEGVPATMLREVGRALGSMAGETDPGEPGWRRVDAEGWRARTGVQLERMELLFPDEAGPVRAAWNVVTREWKSLPVNKARVLAHGDLHPGQIYFSGDGNAMKFIDPDSMGLAPVEWDAANLAAHLDMFDLDRSSDVSRSPVEGLVEGVSETLSGNTDFHPGRFETLRRLARVRLAAVYGCRPRFHARSQMLAQSVLDTVSGAKTAIIAAAVLVGSMFGGLVSAEAAGLERIREGLWVEVELDADHEPGRRMDANEIEVKLHDASRREKIRGPISAFSGETGELNVFDVPVKITADTEIQTPEGKRVDGSALSVGMRVKIAGRLDPRGRFTAETLEILAGDRAEKDPEVEGYVTDVKRSSGRVRFAINGLRVEADAGTDLVFRPGTEALTLPPIVVASSVIKRSDPDWQPQGTSIFGNADLTVGGRINTKVMSQRDLDLDGRLEGNAVRSNVHTRFYGRWDPSVWTQAYMELRMDGRRDWLDTPLGDSVEDGSRFALGPSYFLVRPKAFPYVAAQIGRVDVDERREWFYDQNMDGVRLFLLTWKFQLQAGHFRRELSPDPGDRDEAFTILNLSFPQNTRFQPELHYIRREDRRSIDDRRWIGFRLPLTTRNLETWSDVVWGRGDYRGNAVRTWAYDVGFLARNKRPLRFSVYAGLAAASGDPDRADGIDREFRDTGLADNNDSFDGVKSFYYYGELTRPELSNLTGLTVGTGIRPVPWGSIDVVWHRYRQQELRDRFRSELDDLGVRPEGGDKDLGTEIDVVFGVRNPFPVDVELTWSRFTPGAAFAITDPATQFKFEIEKKW